MSQIAAYVLTVLAAVVVALTRLRLRHRITGWPLAVHSWGGAAAVVLWLVFLALPADSRPGALIGVIGLGCWWAVSVAGIVLLLRWFPSRRRGKRAAPTVAAADSWTGSPWLSVLAHVGMLLGVLWFTWAYVFTLV